MPLYEEVQKIVENKSPLYKKDIINQIVFVFVSTQFYFFILGFDSLITCLVYICEKSEKNLLPKIILPIFEELIDKKFIDFLSKYKDYSQKEKEEIIKASFDEKKIKYYKENPIGKEEVKNIVSIIDNQESNLIVFYEKIFKIGFSLLFPIFKDKSVANIIKSYDEFIKILSEEIEKLNIEEKKIILESFLQVDELKYTNFLQQMVIYCILTLTKSKGNNKEINYLIKVEKFDKLLEILEKFKNGENELISLFNFNTKEINIENIFNKEDIKIYIYGKEIIEFKNQAIKYYEIIKQKDKTNYYSTYICQNFLAKEEEEELLSLIRINLKEIKSNKELFKRFKKSVTKEIELRNYIYDLNESSLKLYNYLFLENELIMVNEAYDCNLKDLLAKKNKLSLKEIKNIFRQINAFLQILITNKINNIGLRPENILIKYKNENKEKYQIKINYYCLSNELNYLINDDVLFKAPELIKNINNRVDKSELFTIGVILYFLFMGTYPFGINSKEIYSKLENNNSNFYLAECADIQFKDLLNKLLQFEPSCRLEWDEYFKHDFFRIKFDNNGKII